MLQIVFFSLSFSFFSFMLKEFFSLFLFISCIIVVIKKISGEMTWSKNDDFFFISEILVTTISYCYHAQQKINEKKCFFSWNYKNCYMSTQLNVPLLCHTKYMKLTKPHTRWMWFRTFDIISNIFHLWLLFQFCKKKKRIFFYIFVIKFSV